MAYFGFDFPLNIPTKEEALDDNKLYANESEFLRKANLFINTGSNIARVGISPWLSSPEQLAVARNRLTYLRKAGMKICFTLAQLANIPEESAAEKLIKNSRYINTIADSLGDLLDYVQVLNEWDAADWRNWPDKVDLADEAYLKETAATIKMARDILRRANRKVKVFTSITGETGDRNRELHWRKAYDAYISPVVDLIGINWYGHTWEKMYRELPERLDNVSSRYGRKIAITEFGISRFEESDPHARGYWLSMMLSALSHSDSLELAAMYQYVDAENAPSGPESTFGVMNTPEEYAVTAMIKHLNWK